MSSKPYNKTSLTGLTQAGGAQTLTLSAGDQNFYQIYITTSAAPTAGTLALSVAYPDSNTFVALKDADGNAISITMNDPQAVVVEYAVISKLRVTPTSFDADKTYSVFVLSDRKEA